MADSIAVFPAGQRVTDDNGAPVASGTLEFYNAGSSTPKTVYSDSALSTGLGTTVNLDSAGYPVSGGSSRTLIYTGTASYKVVAKTAAGVTVWSHDNVRGADVLPSSVASALSTTPVLSRSTTTTIDGSNYSTYTGRLINCNCSSASFAVTLPSAVTVGDGWRVGIRHAGNANAVTIRCTGGQTIAGPGYFIAPSVALTGSGHTYWIVSNGASWVIETEVPPLMASHRPYILVKGRRASPPASPVPGDRYLIDGTPTGSWATSSFSDGNIAESDGNGGWLEQAARSGYLLYVEDEQLLVQYRGAAWVDLSNITAPNSSTLEVLEVSYDGTGTNSIAASTWTTITLNTSHKSGITSGSLNTGTGTITLPNGSYLVFGSISAVVPQSTSASVRSRIYSSTGSASKVGSTNARGVTVALNNITLTPTLLGFVQVTAETEDFVLQWFSSDNNVTLGSTDSSGVTNKYAEVTILDLASLQGPRGERGLVGYESGAGGAVTQATSKATGVTLNAPCGAITLNNASLASGATVAFTLTNSYIDATDVPVVAIKSGATASSYTVTVTAVAAGSCRIELRNTSGGSLAEACVLSFAVIKAVAA